MLRFVRLGPNLEAVPLPRFAKLPEERRAAILDAARTEFAEHGFASASYNRIIAATGISKGAMYYYFVDKTDLYLAVLEDVLDRVETQARAMGPLTADTEDAFWDELSDRALRLHLDLGIDAELAAFGHKLYTSGIGLQHISWRLSEWMGQLIQIGVSIGFVRTDLPVKMLAQASSGLMMGLDRYHLDEFAKRGLGVVETEEEAKESFGHTITLCRSLLSRPTRG